MISIDHCVYLTYRWGSIVLLRKLNPRGLYSPPQTTSCMGQLSPLAARRQGHSRSPHTGHSGAISRPPRTQRLSQLFPLSPSAVSFQGLEKLLKSLSLQEATRQQLAATKKPIIMQVQVFFFLGIGGPQPWEMLGKGSPPPVPLLSASCSGCWGVHKLAEGCIWTPGSLQAERGATLLLPTGQA